MRDELINTIKEDDNVSEILSNPIPYKLGKYEIIVELGRGTSGIVYKGFDPFVRREVAIKVGWSDLSQDKDKDKVKLDFFTEAHAAGKLQHPNIVALYDAQMEKDLSYIVMEYVKGETLLEYCRKNGKRLPPEKVLESMFKCCMALDFSHRMGVIHRDIKPSNIMLSDEGETKLMDFSVAEITQNRKISPSMIVGSPSYMSPEQVQAKEVGPQSDLYSLAAVMFQLLTGKTLFPSENMKQTFYDIVHKTPPSLKDLRPDLPEALSDIIDKALSKNPADRYESGRAMAAELTEVYDRLIYTGQNISRGEKRHILKKLKFFSDFTDSHLDEIMTVSTVLSFALGEVISREGDIDNSFYIIMQGTAKVIKADKLLVTLNQGDCFGEIGFLTPTRTTTLVAGLDLTLLKVNAVRIETLGMECRMLFYKAFCENLIYRLSSKNPGG
jgi:serine/threonine-protein kinase